MRRDKCIIDCVGPDCEGCRRYNSSIMTKEELAEKWQKSKIAFDKDNIPMVIDDEESKEEILSDLNEVTRGELIAYDKWVARNKWGLGEILTPEQSVNEYLKQQK